MGHAFTGIRDAVEAIASTALNFVLPGSGLITDQLVSKGAQKDLSSPLGVVANLGSGVAGGLAGNLGNYSALGNAITGGGTAATAAAAPAAVGAAPSVVSAGALPALASAPTDFSSAGGLDDIFGTAGAPDAVGSLIASTAPAAVSPAAASAATSSGSSGLLGTIGSGLQTAGSDLSGILSNPLVKDVEGLAPAAIGGMELSNQSKLQSQALGLQQQEVVNEQPVLSSASQALQQYQAGTISPAQQDQLTQLQQQADAQVRQAYANMGLTGSSQEASALAQVDQQVQAQQAGFVQQNFQNAMSALGIANSAYQGITQSQLSTSQGMQAALQQLATALGGAQAKTAS